MQKGLMAWFAEYLDSISERFASSAITFAFELHLTGAAQASLAGDGEKLRHCTRRVGRPNGAARVAQAAQEARSRRASSLALLVCGPQGLADDVANATARLQGERRGLKEVYLLKEHYSW
jgi:23S rRNA pseudoU1915 N3-methylase RlmH